MKLITHLIDFMSINTQCPATVYQINPVEYIVSCLEKIALSQPTVLRVRYGLREVQRTAYLACSQSFIYHGCAVDIITSSNDACIGVCTRSW